MQYCGNRAPRTAIQAQFSLSYAIAAALVLGDLGPNAYDDLGDPPSRGWNSASSSRPIRTRLRRGAQLTIDDRQRAASPKTSTTSPAIRRCR